MREYEIGHEIPELRNFHLKSLHYYYTYRVTEYFSVYRVQSVPL